MPVLSVEWLLALAMVALTMVSVAALIVAGTAFTTMRAIANTLFPDPRWLERPPGEDSGQFENLTVSNVLSGQRGNRNHAAK